MVSQADCSADRERIPVAISERHVHLTQDVIERLFCDRYHLHEEFRASQPTQFAAQESVTLVGPRGRIAGVRVIGPPRAQNQVEISQTDCQTLGISAPLRNSSDIEDTPGILIEGPRASVRLERGLIRLVRHVHMAPAEAQRLGVEDGDHIDLAAQGTDRRTLFGNVLVRVSCAYRSEFHLDLDEANAAGLTSGAFVTMEKRI